MLLHAHRMSCLSADKGLLAPDAVALVMPGFWDIIIISWETVSKVLLQSHERQTVQNEGSDALFQVAF